MRDLKIQLQDIYTYVRSREWNKTIMNKTFFDYINDEQTKIEKQLNKNEAFLNSIDQIIEQAKNS